MWRKLKVSTIWMSCFLQFYPKMKKIVSVLIVLVAYLKYLIQYNQTYWINVYGLVISTI